MPEIKRYTRQVAPNQVMGARATGQAFGADQSGAMENAQALQQLSGVLEQAVSQRNAREDVIKKAQAAAKYNEEIEAEYLRTTTEGDLVNPEVGKGFNNFVRQKTQEYLNNFDGSPEARANLEASLTSRQGQFVSQMNTTSFNAQQKFITNTVGSHIDTISKQAYADPSKIGDYIKQFDQVMSEYAPAMDAEGEIAFLEFGRAAIMQNVLNSYVDAGQYEQARSFINENPVFLNSIPPESLRTTVQQINSGIAQKEQAINEARNRINTIKTTAEELGVEVSPDKVFSAATNISLADSPQGKLKAMAESMEMDIKDMPKSAIASAYGLSWPEQKSMTEDRKFIIDTIKTPIEDALEVKTRVNSVMEQANNFFETNNQQAGLAAMIAFQKLIDDGAAVREGDIKLSAEGVSAYDKIKLELQKIEEGGIATQEQMRQMVSSADTFLQAALSSRKEFIDPYLEDAAKQGFAPRQVGIPRQSYDEIFEGVVTRSDRNKLNDDVAAKAESHGMSVQQYFQATADSINASKGTSLTAKDIANKLNYTGKF